MKNNQLPLTAATLQKKREILERAGLLRLLNKSGKINIPAHLKSLKIDIGLSYSAPNSALWLKEQDDTMIFGFEPNPQCIAALKAGACHGNDDPAVWIDAKSVIIPTGEKRRAQENDQECWVREEDLLPYEERFELLTCALDDVDSPCYQKFFMTRDDPGCSSLYKPCFFALRNVVDVPVISFYDFLSLLPWDRIPYIDCVKIDTQGKDYDILKSAKEYLQKIVFPQVEMSTGQEYEAPNREKDIEELLLANDFELLQRVDVDGAYYNKKYKHLRETFIINTLALGRGVCEKE
jgi:hypothetical protein